jgi:hypothetical protein
MYFYIFHKYNPCLNGWFVGDDGAIINNKRKAEPYEHPVFKK